ncbi:hypothetical protein ACFQ4Z_12970 [Oceanobacillus oncorhynchi subsp. oncorhynchi]|uniref:hypothetical protein n=1 Tax=Oceanobacillus oncorhynchi TaxID=545501 RepID=UPI00363D8623
MNHFQPQHPNGQENRQNNLPGQMLNNYFQPAPQHDYSNEAFTGRPDGESGGQGGYQTEPYSANSMPPQYDQQHPANPMPSHYEQQHPANPMASPYEQEHPANHMVPPYEQGRHSSPERIGGFFPGGPNGNGNGINFPEGMMEQMIDMFPEPPNNDGNGSGNGGAFPNWPPAPSFPNFPENGGNEGTQGQQPAPAGMGGMNSQPPMGPPPNFVPQKQQVQTFAVDPGGIRHCMFRFTYIWPNHGRGFWAFPTFLGRNSIAGFRWNGFRWVYFGMDLNSIESFQCM